MDIPALGIEAIARLRDPQQEGFQILVDSLAVQRAGRVAQPEAVEDRHRGAPAPGIAELDDLRWTLERLLRATPAWRA